MAAHIRDSESGYKDIYMINTVLNYLITILAPYSVLGIGWIIAFIMIAYFLKSLKSKDKLLIDKDKQLKNKDREVDIQLAAKDKELLDIQTQHIRDVEGWSKRLDEIHSKQNNMITELTDKRVDDLKGLVEDYNELATSVVTSLDKLANNIKSKNRI